jgi:hypothetical protein
MSISKLKQILLVITRELKNNDINYVLGGSLLLYLEGIDTTVQDIDLLIDIEDIEKLKKTLNNYDFKSIEANQNYRTEHFYTINIEGIDIDIMAGFKVQTKIGLYEFPFKIEKTLEIGNEIINLCSIKEWLKAYQAMNRKDKVEIIKNHIQSQAISNR